jgi:hypothetical protein
MARTVRTKVYKFSELGEPAKQKALDKLRIESYERPGWDEENINSMKAFAEIFPIKLTNWSVGGSMEYVSFGFETDREEIEELSAQRLSTYIWNNYKNSLYKGKFYNGLYGYNKSITHKRVKTVKYKNGNIGNYYYSAITFDNNCPLTGYCGDHSLLDPIYEFMKKPRNITFRELLEECFEKWIKYFNEDRDYQSSDEFLEEEAEANEYEFTQDGRRF